jgi:hypothetical protein
VRTTETSDGHSCQAAADESAVSPPEAGEPISVTIVTMGQVRRLDDLSRKATVAEVAERVRRETAIDWDGVIVTVRSGDSALRVVSPQQTLREAGIATGDTLLLTPRSIVWGSGWQEVAVFLADSAAAGVVGAAATGLLKATIKSMSARWRERRGSSAIPSLSRDEAFRIAQSCLSLSTRIDDQRDLKAVSMRHEAAGDIGPEMWIFSFSLPDRWVEVKVLVPEEGPEHTMVLLDHRPGGYLSDPHGQGQGSVPEH